MAGSAAAAGGAGGSAPVATGGNPFQLATNLYAEKNNTGSLSAYTVVAGSASGAQGGQVNAGNFMRRVNLIFRTSTLGTTGVGSATVSDLPWNALTGVDLVNVDGSEILYTMGGYAHYLVQKYGRPWLGDPAQWQDASVSTTNGIQFTLPLQPEIRWTAGVLANTDTRSQYRIDYVVDSATNFLQGGTAYSAGTTPVVNVTPYLDAWAQPDATDLQGTPNQPLPPGLNLQNKRRHQINTLNTGSDNILQSALTGNALRLQVLVTRSGTGSTSLRTDVVTDPLTWQLDNRSLGKYSSNGRLQASNVTLQNGQAVNTGGDMLDQRAMDFYDEYFPVSPILTYAATNTPLIATAYQPYTRDVGVYVFPRFLKPGTLYGEGWLYTANSTKEIFEFTTITGLTTPTWELITDEVYPVGPVDPALTDI